MTNDVTGQPEIGLFEAMYTQRAIRRFKPDPIPRETLTKLVEAATKAPNGANQQPWAFVVIDEQPTLAAAGEIAQAFFEELMAGAMSRHQPGDPPPLPNLKRMMEHVEDIPAWIVVCFDPPSKNISDVPLMSLMPAVQNLLLAARGLGIGGVMTGMLAGSQTDKTKALLGLPEHVIPFASIPLGYPADGVRYGPTNRRPVQEVLHWGRWDDDKQNSAKIAYRTGI